MDEIKSGLVPFPDPAGNQKPVPVISLLFRLAMPKIMLLSETAKNRAEIWLYMNGEPTP